MYRIVCHGTRDPGVRVTAAFRSVDLALDLYERLSKSVLQIPAAKVQLFDGEKQISETVGPELRPAIWTVAPLDPIVYHSPHRS